MSHRIHRTALLTVAALVTLSATAHATQPVTVPGGLTSAQIWLAGKSAPAARPPARISTEVTRAGKRRELTWWVLRQPGQRVIFEDRGPSATRVLASTRGGTGSVRFRPAKGPAGLRRIVARVEIGGVLSEERTVARFRVRRG